MREMFLGGWIAFEDRKMVFFKTARENTEKNNGSVVTTFYIIFLPLFWL